MKKVILGIASLALLFSGCTNDQNENINEQSKVDMSDFFVHTNDLENGSVTGKTGEASSTCASMQVLNRQLAEDPKLYKKMYDIEHHTRSMIAAKGKPGGNGGGNGGGGSSDEDVDVLPDSDNLGVIDIPVYVHIIYPNSNTISSAQVTSQINVLNADFRNTNVSQLPSGTAFANDATDAGFHFTLAGTFRHDDGNASWGTNNSVKAAYPPITPATHLNIWVCNIGGGILGYAQFPGGNSSTDGVVLGGDYFGETSGVYGLGRTATHEVGHYFNLRHIWGDGRCRQDDFVTDTPSSDGANYACPSYPTVNCKSADMTMNYMDYVYDSCMYMFTDGQRNRMRPLFASGGARAQMAGN
jgi:hypothetical protein